DAHRHPKAPRAPAAATDDAGSAAEPGPVAAFSETAAESHWTTPDEKEGATKFALEEYHAARAAFLRARKATKDEQQIARIELMLGLCSERTNDATTASKHFLAAYAKLPLLSDYIGYRAARTLW